MDIDLEVLPARRRGRPSSYKSSYCDRVLNLATEGCCKAEIAVGLGVSVKTLNAWAATYDDFREAMSAGEGAGICVVAGGGTQGPVHADVEFKRLGAADAQSLPQTLPRSRSGQGRDTGGQRECRATPRRNGTQAISHR